MSSLRTAAINTERMLAPGFGQDALGWDTFARAPFPLCSCCGCSSVPPLPNHLPGRTFGWAGEHVMAHPSVCLPPPPKKSKACVVWAGANGEGEGQEFFAFPEGSALAVAYLCQPMTSALATSLISASIPSLVTTMGWYQPVQCRG